MQPSSEFAVIAHYFASVKQSPNQHTELGIGDDCAILKFKAPTYCAISTDMLVAGQHFLAKTDPYQLGFKALAVNLSDLAAMGATPRAFTLALSLPALDHAWLERFSQGLFDLAQTFDCELIGGDTTRGPLSICITIFGETTKPHALNRKNAQANDDIWVSGELGLAAAGLAILQNRLQVPASDAQLFLQALHMPCPRIELGQALQSIAHAAIDLSDGLSGDLMHILAASHLNASISLDALPCSTALSVLPQKQRWQFMLAGGDDYELCFTASPTQRETLARLSQQLNIRLSRIGQLEARSKNTTSSIRWKDKNEHCVPLELQGFNHFYGK